LRDRLVGTLERDERVGEIAARADEVGLDGDRLPVLHRRLLEAVEQCERHAEVIARVRGFGSEFDGAADRADRFGGPALLDADDAEVVQRVDVTWVEAKNSLVEGRGLRQLPVPLQNRRARKRLPGHQLFHSAGRVRVRMRLLRHLPSACSCGRRIAAMLRAIGDMGYGSNRLDSIELEGLGARRQPAFITRMILPHAKSPAQDRLRSGGARARAMIVNRLDDRTVDTSRTAPSRA
jgi:hypothetical protein